MAPPWSRSNRCAAAPDTAASEAISHRQGVVKSQPTGYSGLGRRFTSRRGLPPSGKGRHPCGPTVRRLPMKRVMAAVALVGGAILGLSTLALASSIVVISGPSPYSGCSNAGQSGTNFVNAEEEPFASVNPANSANVIATFQQDRWSNGGAHGLVAASSSNGGASWGETTLPFSIC